MNCQPGFAFPAFPFSSLRAKRARICRQRRRTNPYAHTGAKQESIARSYSVDVALWDGLTARGAAFCVTPGHFLTCFHVIAHASKIFINGRRAHLLRVCRAADVAVLSCAPLAADAPPHELSEAGIPPQVYVSRSPPYTMPVRGLRNRLYASGATLPAVEVLDGRAVLRPGDSGEPLYDARTGKVAGMFAATGRGECGYAYAVPAALLRRVIDDVRRVVRLGALAGVEVHSLALPLVRAAAGVGSGICGVRVATGGERYGVCEGDVICEVGGVTIATESTLSTEVAQSAPGDCVRIMVWRHGCGMVDLGVVVDDAECTRAAVGWAPGRVVVSLEGFVFMALSFEYLSRWGHNWYEKCPPELLRTALKTREVGKGARHVVVLAVAPEGYDELLHKTVECVGGRAVKCLGDMVRFSRQRVGGKDSPTVVRLYGGIVVEVGECSIERGRLDPRSVEELYTT